MTTMPDRSLRELIDLAPDAADRARERFAVRDYHGAVLLLEEAVAGGCGYADAYNLLGLSLAMVDRPLDALAAFDRALAQNPRYVEAHLNRVLPPITVRSLPPTTDWITPKRRHIQYTTDGCRASKSV